VGATDEGRHQMWNVRCSPILVIRSCQATIGVPSTVCRGSIFLFSASEGSAARRIYGRSCLVDSGSANKSGASAMLMWCSTY
jgi:hypothetical protein